MILQYQIIIFKDILIIQTKICLFRISLKKQILLFFDMNNHFLLLYNYKIIKIRC